jgi:protein-L-isoaspartate(D-aspartate) O-methyltransferase
MRVSTAALALHCLAAAPCAAEPAPPAPQAAPDPYAGARAAMVAWLGPQLLAAGLRDDPRLRAILRVIGRLPREDFVPAGQRASAYAPTPLPIGGGQTISDPFIMAYMTRKLELRPSDRVLEIGTGSGYQAAILGALVERVHSIEIIPELAERAALTLREHGFANVQVRQGDGYAGWPEAAPFDAIIVTAGAVRIPPALVAQLRPGGRMILPLGANWAEQRMTLVRKRRDGSIDVSACGWVVFVPFVGPAQTREPGAQPASRRRLNARCDESLGVRMRQIPADDFARPDR